MGTINFVRIFVPDFAQTVKPLQQMVKQNAQFKWTQIEKSAFRKIKTVVAHAPSLKSPDFDKDFILYTFASNDSLAVVLTQKEDGGDEFPISFMSTSLQGAELNYPTIDKQAYAVFKAVKQFRPYILKNQTKVIVPHPSVRSLFVQKELGERRGNWVIALQEYDLKFRPASIVKWQGLCKLMTKNRNNEEHAQQDKAELHWMDVCPLFTAPESWY